MTAEIVQVNFRMPADLKARLEEASAENRRTLTAELIARLEASFEGWTLAGIEISQNNQMAIHDSLSRIEAQLVALGAPRLEAKHKMLLLMPAADVEVIEEPGSRIKDVKA